MKYIFLLLVLLFVSGCSTKVAHLNTVSSNNVDFSKEYIRGEKKVSGKTYAITFYILPLSGKVTINPAIKNTLNESCSEYLTDVDIHREFWNIPLLFIYEEVSVNGYPWYEKDEKRIDCIK